MQTIYWSDFLALGLVGELEKRPYPSTNHSITPASPNNEKTTETRLVLEPG